MEDKMEKKPEDGTNIWNTVNKGITANRTIDEIVDLLIRLFALGLLVYWSYSILQPFITIAIWSVILAVSLYPVYNSLRKRLWNKQKLAAGVITAILLMLLIAPAIWMLIASGSELKGLADQLKAGTFKLPLPGDELKGFPLIGPYLYDIWNNAVNNLQGFAIEYQEQIKAILIRLFGLIASTGKGLLILAVSIVVSGVLLAYADAAAAFTGMFFKRVAGDSGSEMTNVAAVTIRNVTRGILGVAFIQAMLAGIGIYIAGVPLAGLWTMICFLLSVMQLGMLPVSAGVIIYIWTAAPTSTAIMLTVWMVLVGTVDNILKPILLGKGAPVPMLIVFLGAIGGFIQSGFIGLFTGAIILTLGYNLFIDWVKQHQKPLS